MVWGPPGVGKLRSGRTGVIVQSFLWMLALAAAAAHGLFLFLWQVKGFLWILALAAAPPPEARRSRP